MNLMKAPPKAEVMGWDPHCLADYMKRLKLAGCDRIVLKGGINGAQFMNMTECDLKVFPFLYLPIIIKIQSEINEGKQKKVFGAKSKTSECAKPAHVEMDVWDSDEFDNESDLDSDHSHQQEDIDKHMPDLSEQQTSEYLLDDDFNEISLNLPAQKSSVKLPQNPKAVKPQESHKGAVTDSWFGKRSSKYLPSRPPKQNITPKPQKIVQASQPSVQKSRSKRPVQGDPLKDDSKLEGSAAKAGGSSAGKAHTRPPKHRSVPNSAPAPCLPADPRLPYNSMAGAQEGLDLRWYGGKLTRHQGEIALREVNKDGAFMVRDSSKGSGDHLYTLMVLNNGKVYNIKICSQGDSFYLGNGIAQTKSFPGVTEMITHHTRSPLPLVDADQTSEMQPLCCLLYPAGL